MTTIVWASSSLGFRFAWPVPTRPVKSYDIQAPQNSGVDGQYEVYGYIVDNGDLQMKLSPSGSATAGDSIAPAAGYANPQLTPTNVDPHEDTPFDPFYASFNWLATVAQECGVVDDASDAAIDSLF